MSDLISELKRAYTSAEELANEVANLCDEVIIPAHNQLRYAGYHLLESISCGPAPTFQENYIREAITHCERAMYDAAEAGTMYAILKIRDFLGQYPKYIVVSQVVENVSCIRRDIGDVELLLSKGRGNLSSDIKELSSVYRIMVSHLNDLSNHADDLNAMVLSERRKTRSTIMVAIGGAVLAAVLSFVL